MQAIQVTPEQAAELLKRRVLMSEETEYTIYSRSTGRIFMRVDDGTFRHVVSGDKSSVEAFLAKQFNASDWYISEYRK